MEPQRRGLFRVPVRNSRHPAEALRKQNKVASDIMKELKLGELSEGAKDAGKKLSYKEAIAVVKAALGLLR
jgi:hypothetical protein